MTIANGFWYADNTYEYYSTICTYTNTINIFCDSGYHEDGGSCVSDGTVCPAGEYYNGTVCDLCDVGYYCPGVTADPWAGVQGLVNCPDNYQSGIVLGYPEGKTNFSSEDQCQAFCSPGSYVSTIGQECTVCPAGFYCSDEEYVNYGEISSNPPVQCPAGYNDATGAIIETDCKTYIGAGYFAGGTGGAEQCVPRCV